MKLVGAGSPSSVWDSGQGELSPLLQRMTSLCALVKSIELFSPKIYPTAHLPLWDCFCCGPCVLFLSGTYCYLTFIYLQVHFFNCLAPIHPHTHIRIFKNVHQCMSFPNLKCNNSFLLSIEQSTYHSRLLQSCPSLTVLDHTLAFWISLWSPMQHYFGLCMNWVIFLDCFSISQLLDASSFWGLSSKVPYS